MTRLVLVIYFATFALGAAMAGDGALCAGGGCKSIIKNRAVKFCTFKPAMTVCAVIETRQRTRIIDGLTNGAGVGHRIAVVRVPRLRSLASSASALLTVIGTASDAASPSCAQAAILFLSAPTMAVRIAPATPPPAI